MGILLESPARPLSISDVAKISRQLADDISRLVLRTEGFSVDDYLSLGGSYFVEFLDGCLQVLPMPNALHQAIAFVVANFLIEWSKPDTLARTKLGPFRIRVSDTEFREPDVCFMRGEHAGRRTDSFWNGADLAVEVVSKSNHDHDYQTKKSEYAVAGIPEYWIVDPDLKRVTVHKLQGKEYILHGEFGVGQVAESSTLIGFVVDVSDLFARAEAQA